MSAEIITKLSELFPIGSAEPIALRALMPKGQRGDPVNELFTATQFPEPEDRRAAFYDRCLRLNNCGYNIYTMLNSVADDFTGRAVGNRNISRRRRLLIDLDRAGETTDPATDDEIRAALQVSDQIVEWFKPLAKDEPIRVMSGNGIHVYYAIDWPNDKASQVLCQNLLLVLGREFNNETIKVDTGVHDAARITKVPGTIMRKGVASPERPFRKAMFLDAA